MFYVCMVCEDFFESDKKPGKIEEEWSNPALCPVCNSDEVRESSSKEIKKNTNAEKRGEKNEAAQKRVISIDLSLRCLK